MTLLSISTISPTLIFQSRGLAQAKKKRKGVLKGVFFCCKTVPQGCEVTHLLSLKATVERMGDLGSQLCCESPDTREFSRVLQPKQE